MSVSQLNKKTYCEAGFIEGDVALSCIPEEHVDLHWDRKKHNHTIGSIVLR